MDYKGTIEFLYGLYRHGIKLGLESVSGLLQKLGNPQSRYETLHVGGTNGKGSTSAILAGILEASGCRVGLYTSPHLSDFRERIRVNGTYIPESTVIELTRYVQATTPSTLTFFEFTTAMAFQYFADQEVDLAVIEVGMGGRFDATNVLNPLGVVITTIAHDHERYLGNQLTEIAFEKAGIIKEHTPVILGEMSDEVSQVLRGVARDRRARCFGLGSEFHVVPESSHEFRYHGINRNLNNLSCSLVGAHQMKNAGCALAVLEAIEYERISFQGTTIRSALSAVEWEGRAETLQVRPRLVIDGAHNPAAAKVLVETLAPMVREHDGQLIVILGMMQDKNQAEFMRVLCPVVSHLILTRVSVLRAATIPELKRNVPEGIDSLHEAMHPAEALRIARRLAKTNDVICATGSLFLAGEVRNLLTGS